MLRRLVILIVLVSFLAGSLLGCGRAPGKLDQVKLGMTKAEVVNILGEPQEKENRAQGSELLRWRYDKQTVVLVLNQDRVAGKQIAWSDGKGQ